MKVKILIVPLAIAIVVIFTIWFVYPTFSNGTDGVKEKYGQVKKERQNLSDI